MSMKWKQGEWEIHRDSIGEKAGGGWCLRHTGCCTTTYPSDDIGQCVCSKGECYVCNTEVPEEIKGFFALVKWKR